MKLLKKLNPENLNDNAIKDYRGRNAARAILMDENNNIALLHVRQHKYHKLPGGGVKKGEKINNALARECLEETGCKIQVGKEIGSIVEYREKYQLKQFSDCFFATVVGNKGKPSFTDKEITNEFELLWVNIEEAIKLLKNDSPIDYEGKFIKERDTIFVREAIKIL